MLADINYVFIEGTKSRSKPIEICADPETIVISNNKTHPQKSGLLMFIDLKAISVTIHCCFSNLKAWLTFKCYEAVVYQ